MQAEASHQEPKYEKLNKYFTKRKIAIEETVNLSDYSYSDSSSISESNNSSPENGKTSIAYDSNFADNDKISSSSVSSEDKNRLNGCRDAFIIDK